MQDLIIEKITPTAKLPSRAYQDDAGLDLFADQTLTLAPLERAVVPTGIKLALPSGYVGLVWDKGGLAKQGLHTLAGVVDAGYRGEVLGQVINLSQNAYEIKAGQKIAQLLIQPVALPRVREGKIIDQTERGSQRHGSSGLA